MNNSTTDVVFDAEQFVLLLSQADRATLVCEGLKALSNSLYLPDALEDALLQLSKNERDVKGVLEAVVLGFGLGYTRDILDEIEDEHIKSVGR